MKEGEKGGGGGGGVGEEVCRRMQGSAQAL